MAVKPPKPDPQSPPDPEASNGLFSLFLRVGRYGTDAVGVFLLALAAMTILGLLIPDWTSGYLITPWIEFLLTWFGWGIVWLITAIGIAGLWLLRRQQPQQAPPIPWGRVLALELAAFASMVILAIGSDLQPPGTTDAFAGGIIGWALGEITHRLLAGVGFSALLFSALVWMLVLFLGLFLGLGLTAPVAAWARRTRSAAELQAQEPLPPIVMPAAPETSEVQSAPPEKARKKRVFIPEQFRKRFPAAPQTEQAPAALLERGERLPPYSLLADEKSSRPDQRHINQTAGLIEKTLSEFGIPVQVEGYQVGPTVTQFAIKPGFVEKPGEDNQQKVRVAQITALQRDLSLALSAQRLRIQAPVPGRPFVGIEVPNTRSAEVHLRPILESSDFQKVGSPLAIGLGRDVSGQPVVADLTKMPHLLIAGTTGSGKSVCIAALT
ncbi:MAG TPA: DNA translocase FtsK, partial [Anaerolineales bacterium]|nr:DNA translocase FtsK [Anaerolineales bacterium]